MAHHEEPHKHFGERIGRRSFIGLGVGSLVTALTGLDAIAAKADEKSNEKRGARAKRVLVIFEQGGLSHLDTWDPKPDAPLEHRSPFKPISTNVPGMQFTELLSKTAKFADKLTVVRCMIQPTPGIGNSHPKGAQYIYTGEAPGGPVEMPDIGSVLAYKTGTDALYLPSNIMVPGTSEMGNLTSVGFLPPGYTCFKTGGSPAKPDWRVPNLGLMAGIDEGRFKNRKDLLSALDVGFVNIGTFQRCRRHAIADGTGRRYADQSADAQSLRFGQRNAANCAKNMASAIAVSVIFWAAN